MKIKLIKDDTILNLLKHLQQKFGKGSFQIDDHWKGDLCAIGISDNNNTYLMYISSYNQPWNMFFVEVEDKAIEDPSASSVEVFESISLNELEKVFKRYFEHGNKQ